MQIHLGTTFSQTIGADTSVEGSLLQDAIRRCHTRHHGTIIKLGWHDGDCFGIVFKDLRSPNGYVLTHGDQPSEGRPGLHRQVTLDGEPCSLLFQLGGSYSQLRLRDAYFPEVATTNEARGHNLLAATEDQIIINGKKLGEELTAALRDEIVKLITKSFAEIQTQVDGHAGATPDPAPSDQPIAQPA